MEPERRTPRSFLASVVGWLIAGLVAYWLLGALFGTIRFLVHILLWGALLGGLLWLWVRLKSSD